MNYIFCAYRRWALELYKIISKKLKNFFLITSKTQLNKNKLNKIRPKFIFFPDWSWKIPDYIYKNYYCVCFHESDLPKFRGGSPLQNQIIRGITKTKTTAFLMNEKIDGGDIIMKKSLSLEGNLQDIFERMKKNDFEIIENIIKGNFRSRKQIGVPTFYKRRKPEESELNLNKSKEYIYNFIRMLSDPYPNAFIKIGKHKIVFQSAAYEDKELKIVGKII